MRERGVGAGRAASRARAAALPRGAPAGPRTPAPQHILPPPLPRTGVCCVDAHVSLAPRLATAVLPAHFCPRARAGCGCALAAPAASQLPGGAAPPKVAAAARSQRPHLWRRGGAGAAARRPPTRARTPAARAAPARAQTPGGGRAPPPLPAQRQTAPAAQTPPAQPAEGRAWRQTQRAPPRDAASRVCTDAPPPHARTRAQMPPPARPPAPARHAPRVRARARACARACVRGERLDTQPNERAAARPVLRGRPARSAHPGCRFRFDSPTSNVGCLPSWQYRPVSRLCLRGARPGRARAHSLRGRVRGRVAVAPEGGLPTRRVWRAARRRGWRAPPKRPCLEGLEGHAARGD